MDKDTREGMASSVKNDWGTPDEVMNVVYQMGKVELDPCANLRSGVKANKKIALPQDGLAVSWWKELPTKEVFRAWDVPPQPIVEGLVFVNPPYGRQVKKWMEKCVHEAKQGCEIISLVAARVDTKWFQENIFDTADAVCFWKGRIKFVDLHTGEQGDPAFFPSAIAYWGPNVAKFQQVFSEQGKVVLL